MASGCRRRGAQLRLPGSIGPGRNERAIFVENIGMKPWLLPAMVVPLSVAASAQSVPSPPPTPPVAAQKPYTVKGPVERNDEYYWLRDDTRKSPEMLAYLNAENAYADAYLAPLKPLEDRLYAEIVGRIKQDDSKATYEGKCGPDNARIDFGKPWEQIDRLIRGCNPAPAAWANINGVKLKILEATPLPARDPKGIAGKIGEVVAIESDGVTVVCADGRFKLTRVQADGPKVGAGEWAAAAKIEKGARFS